MLLSFLVIILALALNTQAENVLLIGDSVDRYTVFDFCGKHNATIQAWGDHSIKYGGQKGTKTPSAYCELPNGDSIAFLHIFGSSGTGPYLYIDTWKDPYAATTPRIMKALELYHQQIGFKKLSKIIFHSLLWDFRPFRSDVLDDEYQAKVKQTGTFKSLQDFRSSYINEHKNESLVQQQVDIIGRLHEILQIIESHAPNHTITIGVRTAAWYQDGGVMIHATNDLVRLIAKASKLAHLSENSVQIPSSLPAAQMKNTVEMLTATTKAYTSTETFAKFWKQMHGDVPVPDKVLTLPVLDLYDLDEDLWTKAGYDYTAHAKYFRDEHHPSVEFMQYVGDVYLGYTKTKFYYSSNRHEHQANDSTMHHNHLNHNYQDISYHKTVINVPESTRRH